MDIEMGAVDAVGPRGLKEERGESQLANFKSSCSIDEMPLSLAL